jgi:hypothetical protein
MTFKNKPLVLDSGKRIKKGVSCERGHKKETLMIQINGLLDKQNGLKKYRLGKVPGKSKEQLVNIYDKGGDNILFYQMDEEGQIRRSQKVVSLSTMQLCIELELIFRYYTRNPRKNGKIWFLNELEANLNKIEMVGI